jgi:hypothetical protein
MDLKATTALWHERLSDDATVFAEAICVATIGDESILPDSGPGVVAHLDQWGECTSAVAAVSDPVGTARRHLPDVGWQWAWIPTRSALGAIQVALDLNMKWPDPAPARLAPQGVESNETAPGAFVFFPWLSIENPIRLGEFWLLPFRPNEVPCGLGSREQQVMDVIAGCYLIDPAGDHIDNAVVFAREPRAPLCYPSEDDLQAAFELAQILAADALATRAFFDWPGGYVNADQFRLIAQNFTGEVQGVTHLIRRRDGGVQNYCPIDLYHMWIPEHVAPSWCISSSSFLLSLVEARAKSEWGHIYESIISFNLANTDGHVSAQSEAVLLMAAIERVLNAKAKDTDIVDKFSALFRPSCGIVKTDCERISGAEREYKKTESVAGAWLLDFFAYRGHLAHGRAVDKFKPTWSLREHLLLGSFVYPLLLKLTLAGLNIYELSDEDLARIDAFEHLAALDDAFRCEETEHGAKVSAWTEILRTSRSAQRVERALAATQKAMNELEG